jgi:hypothetical protein
VNRTELLRIPSFWNYELSNSSHRMPRMDPFVLVSSYLAVVNQQGDEDHQL